jgi:hypothetical protein
MYKIGIVVAMAMGLSLPVNAYAESNANAVGQGYGSASADSASASRAAALAQGGGGGGGGGGGSAVSNTNYRATGLAAAPGLAAGAPACLGSVSLGASFYGGGLSGGMTYLEKACESRMLADQLFRYGLRREAVAILWYNHPLVIKTARQGGFDGPGVAKAKRVAYAKPVKGPVQKPVSFVKKQTGKKTNVAIVKPNKRVVQRTTKVKVASVN